MTTRRDILKGGAGLAAILASGNAPAYLVKSMLAARQIFLGRGGGAKLPYDAEVEYLETDGAAWIDTGLPMGSGVATIGKFKFVTTNRRQLMGSNGSRQYYGLTASGNIEFGALNVNDSGISVNANTIYEIGYAAADGNNTCTISSGGTLLFSNSGAYNSFTNNFGIFYCLGLGTGYAFVSGNKVYSFKMLVNDVLVRDLTPVRFTNELGQSEGAMYDRANPTVGMNRDGTPRDDGLYLNRGTGAFGYGGDVYSVPVETSQYVQDGLVAMWDGKENAGVGKHSTAVGAVNLAGGAELVFPSNLAKWSMGARSFDLSLIYHTDTNGRITIPVNTFGLSQFSTEICLLRGSDSTGEFGLIQDGVSFVMDLMGASTALFLAYNSGGGIVINTQQNIGDTTAPRTLTFTYDGTTARFYADGALKTSAAMELRAAFNEGLVRIGSTYLYNSGSIFDIRIYNKALTAEQVSANAAIDQSRFNQP